MAKFGRGPLLTQALKTLGNLAPDHERLVLASASLGAPQGSDKLPVVLKLSAGTASAGGSWQKFKEQTGSALVEVVEQLGSYGIEGKMLFSARSIRGFASAAQLDAVDQINGLDLIELDPLLDAALMDDATVDIGKPTFIAANPGISGSGVRVAVLDSGVDLNHPALVVLESVSTNGEPVSIPGDHGTHCAGSIASQDAMFAGVAPGVDLLNIKVLDHTGRGRPSDIVDGIDAALDRDADILSMSVGFNHLPSWADGGHGWACATGQCALCTAVDNAANLDQKIVVVAAGNSHRTAQDLTNLSGGPHFDTELSCPGQASLALTVGALSKTTHLPAPFSSRGPTSYGLAKPDISAPGINIMSTVPVFRDANGVPAAAPSRAQLFDRKSGTSMATPIVAGICALLIEEERVKNGTWTPAGIVARIKADVLGLPYGHHEVGLGMARLN